MMKRTVSLIMALLAALTLAACAKPAASAAIDVKTADWAEILQATEGTTVSFYGWGGDENRNNWLNTTVTDYLKENYDITLEVVGMNIDDILAKLTNEKLAATESGSIDVIWINGENFYSAKDNGLLFGPFTDMLPAMAAYIDPDDPETNNDFCMPIDGYEAPYGKAQLVLYNDGAATPETPATADELMEYCKKYAGKVTYPALPDFTGSAFVRNVIYELCGWEQFQAMPADYDVVKAAIAPALSYLRALNPYLWNGGRTFPESFSALDAMFEDRELVLSMSYEPFAVATGIDKDAFPAASRTFLFDGGAIGNTNYMAIAFDAPNKAGALAVINAMISAELQLTQYAQLRTLPVVAYDKLSASEKEAFDAVDFGPGVLSRDELIAHRLPEMPASLVPVIEQIWLDEVVGKYND